jgi:hypothetical protein
MIGIWSGDLLLVADLLGMIGISARLRSLSFFDRVKIASNCPCQPWFPRE